MWEGTVSLETSIQYLVFSLAVYQSRYRWGPERPVENAAAPCLDTLSRSDRLLHIIYVHNGNSTVQLALVQYLPKVRLSLLTQKIWNVAVGQKQYSCMPLDPIGHICDIAGSSIRRSSASINHVSALQLPVIDELLQLIYTCVLHFRRSK